jgi:hypothetical protein
MLQFTLKFIPKLLLPVSVQHPPSGSILLVLTKVNITKTICYNTAPLTVLRTANDGTARAPGKRTFWLLRGS